MSSNPSNQVLQPVTSEDEDGPDPGLPIAELTQWCNTLSKLNVSMDDAARLCHIIRGHAYSIWTEAETRRIHREGTQVPLDFRPLPMPRLPRLNAVPSKTRIPNHHHALSYKDFPFVFPYERRHGTYYVVSRGLLVGVFSLWINVAPLVSRVKGATYIAVKSLDKGADMILDAIEDGVVEYLEVTEK